MVDPNRYDNNQLPLIFSGQYNSFPRFYFGFHYIWDALLDVRQEDIYRDYLFSNFGLIGGSRNASAITSYLGRFSLYGGLTLKEQVINYLVYPKIKLLVSKR